MEAQTTKNNPTPVVLAIIAAAVAIIGFLILMEQRREYNAIYPGCWTLLDDGLECEAKVSAYRITSGF